MNVFRPGIGLWSLYYFVQCCISQGACIYLLHVHVYSLLQGLPEPHSQTVTEYVHSTITAALRSDLLAGHLQRLQYLEALGENFSRGELALWRQLPLSKYYICVFQARLMISEWFVLLQLSSTVWVSLKYAIKRKSEFSLWIVGTSLDHRLKYCLCMYNVTAVLFSKSGARPGIVKTDVLWCVMRNCFPCLCRLTDPLFIAALKTCMTILHKTQSAVSDLLLGAFSFHFHSTNTDNGFTWPEEYKDQSTEFKGQRVLELLERAENVCEMLFKTGQCPHTFMCHWDEAN